MFEPKKEVKINMCGEEYLEYLKFRKLEWKIPDNIKKFFSASWIYFAFAGIVVVAMAVIRNILTPVPQPKPFTYSIIYGFPVYHAVITFLMVAIGIAWILHGFGFIVIRR